jgi:hypothetical protein
MLTNDTLTENGMRTHSTSGQAVLDLFYKQGGARAVTDQEIASWFRKAYKEDRTLALKCLFYNRDVRGGQGERRSFRVMFRALCELDPTMATRNLANVPFYGRFDDLFVAVGTSVEDAALGMFAAALRAGDALAAKWAPREGKSKSAHANLLRNRLGLDWKQYRKLLAGLSTTVEQRMCAGEWSGINYSHVPSQAAYKYRKAFRKKDEARYNEYLAKLAAGDVSVKVNAAAVFPHQIVQQVMNNLYGSPDALLEAQWKALPNYVQEGASFIPVVDVSGSMSGEPMNVAVALGLYLSERNVGPFKDAMITFSERPEFQLRQEATLNDRVRATMQMPWGMNTNLEAVFKMILAKAKAAKLKPEELPNSILILSDMQFDQCVRSPSDSALDMISRMYQEAGYNKPQVVFWNLRTSSGVPAKRNSQGVSLVSGFSPSIMKTLLTGVNTPEPTPYETMLDTLNQERYNQVVTD